MRHSLGGSRRDLLFFCYNEATRALTTNLNLNSEVVRTCVGSEGQRTLQLMKPMTPAAMVMALPTCNVVPMNAVYEKLKE